MTDKVARCAAVMDLIDSYAEKPTSERRHAIRAALIELAPGPSLSAEAIERGREQIFSTNNHFCPCNGPTMLKVVRWAERQHKIKD